MDAAEALKSINPSVRLDGNTIRMHATLEFLQSIAIKQGGPGIYEWVYEMLRGPLSELGCKSPGAAVVLSITSFSLSDDGARISDLTATTFNHLHEDGRIYPGQACA